MVYIWWMIMILMYVVVLVTYGLVSKMFDSDSSAADNVFFAVASVITLSVVPLIKSNI
jgi:hypothetical protein